MCESKLPERMVLYTGLAVPVYVYSMRKRMASSQLATRIDKNITPRVPNPWCVISEVLFQQGSSMRD